MAFAPNPGGDRDEAVHFLAVRAEDGQIRALLLNFSCHPSNLNHYRSISSEYPGRLCQLMEAKYYGCTALFFQGCGGDAKLSIGAKGDRFVGIDYAQCDETAQAMALRIDQELLQGRTRPVPVSLSSCVFQIQLPIEPYPRTFFEEERRRYSGGRDVRFDKGDLSNENRLFWACAEYISDHYDELPDRLTLNCGVAALNPDFLIFSMGGEPSYDVKRVLQEIVPGKTMLFFGYNDAIAYIPSDRMLREGGSITEYRLKGELKPGVDALYQRAFENALRALFPASGR